MGSYSLAISSRDLASQYTSEGSKSQYSDELGFQLAGWGSYACAARVDKVALVSCTCFLLCR